MGNKVLVLVRARGKVGFIDLLTMFTIIRPLSILICSLALGPSLNAENWPGWRGPQGDGTSVETNVPVHWSAQDNIAWKTALPGAGHASPIVWHDRVFLISAINDDRVLLAFDGQGGKKLWQQTVVTSQLERKHKLNSHASSTPATDGELVYCAFLDGDDMVVAGYDFMGKQRWLVRPGKFHSMHGFCSSPIIFDDKLIVNGDHDGDSYIVALDRSTGKTIWKTPRENKTRSYCAPIIRQLDGRTQMILSGDKTVASYDPNAGSLHWIIDGPTEQFVASLVYNEKHDMLFLTGGYPDLHILGIRPNGRGNVTKTHVAWRSTRGVSYVPSPISHGDYFFIVSDGGIASCYGAADGKLEWQERLGGDHHASLVSAGGLIYFLADSGRTTVVKAAPQFEVVARNELRDACSASPAISNGRMFVRSDTALYCIGTAGTPRR
jgi:outer membrane protein assembly factor BamB